MGKKRGAIKMTSVISTRGDLRKPSTLGNSQGRSHAGLLKVIDDPFEYTILCPICGKRTLDASGLSMSLVMLRYRCLHCRNIVVSHLAPEGYGGKASTRAIKQ